VGVGGHGRPGVNGGDAGSGGGIDYDLGYDANGFDTDGFRSPEAGPHPEAGPQQARPPRWQPEAPRHHGPAGPTGPAGPRGLRERDRTRVKGSWWRRWTLRKALGALLGVIGGFIVLSAVAVVVAYEQTPVPTEAMAATGFAQSVVYSGHGTLIGRFGTTNRQMLTYNQLEQSPAIINAVLAAEDRNFFTEGGVSPTGIVRAAYEDARGHNGSLQGGSTITQEFVRQYYAGIGTQQTFTRKIKEIFVAMKVAKEKSKPWILTNYLNTIYLGDGAYGVGAAAQTYFGEPVSKLTVAQAAVIAAIIQQPSTYPLRQYHSELVARWHYVLNGMVQMGKLSAQRAAAMKFPELDNNVPQSVGRDVWDPYVLNMVYNELVDVYHFSQSQIYNGGYVIRTTIDDSKMAALYQAVRDNEAQIDAGGVPFDPTYMHAGAVLEDPVTGAIQALYPGPGYPGARYNGTGRVISARYCKKIACEVNMAVYNREQVGSSFKPYILSTAVKQNMNVQTSTLDGYNPLWIPPDSQPKVYGSSAQPANSYQWYKVSNDSLGENRPYTPQVAMAASINTAYADLWHVVGGAAVANMAQAFGVNTTEAGITGPGGMQDEAGIALGQASLTVGEQATMLAAIADGGVYHDAHVISSIRQDNAPPVPLKVTSYPVFSNSPTLNSEEASQVQYAMSQDTASYGTAPTAAMSNGQEIIAKTGTTNTAQSAFFIGAIPSQSLAVALFTNEQGKGSETLNNLGGNPQGGFGGTWPTAIWHTYAENEFVPLGVEQFQTPVFTGMTWNEVPPGLRKVAKKPERKKHRLPFDGNPKDQPSSGPNPYPFPTYSCDPTVVTCNPGGGNAPGGNAAQAGAAAGGIVAGLPATFLWVRRRRARKRGARRG
jgi:membrane peptidoglycan carboxypeptidase